MPPAGHARRASYYDDPAATAEAFAGGWVHTGDVGHVDADGYLHLTDRKKDLIISGGPNVSSVEVENALYEHPAVVDAAVVGLPHPVLGEDVAAAVVVRSPTPSGSCRTWCGPGWPSTRCPTASCSSTACPGTPRARWSRPRSGACCRRRTRPGSAGPRTATEAVVVSVWQAVLGVPAVGVDDDFFALGGHSLAAAQIAARLRDAFGVDLPVAAVFEHPTVAELALVVDRAATG